MKKYVMLTQDNCPNCERLKKMLAGPMKGEFDEVIQKVHRQEAEEDFLKHVRENNISSVPVLINVDTKETLRDFSSGVKIKQFLST